MREASDKLMQLLGAAAFEDLASTDGPIQFGLVADVMRGSERLIADAPLSDWSLSWDSSAMVEVDGSATVVHDERGPDGEVLPLDSSWVPRDIGDPLSAFGSELVVSAWVAAGPFVERVQLGVFPIVATPGSSQSTTNVTGETRLLSETIQVRLADRMDGVQRDRFTRVTGPRSTASAYDELGFLTGRAVARTLPDQPVTGLSAYEDEDRSKAVQQIANILGGDAFFNADGALEVRPKTPGEVALTLTLGPYGRVAEVSSPLSREGVYNGAAVTGKDGLVYAEEWLTSGPLAVQTYGRVPIIYKSDFITTAVQARNYALQLLAERSTVRAQTIEVSCLWNPLVEVGDVVRVVEPDRVRTARVTQVSMGGPMMRVLGTVLS